jgi:hypothetical protein
MSEQQIPEFYVDELSNIMLGYPTSKLTFSSIREIIKTGEGEKLNVLTIAIPTIMLVNACNFALSQVQANQSALIIAASEASENLSSAIQLIELPSAEKKGVVAKKKTTATATAKAKAKD